MSVPRALAAATALVLLGALSCGQESAEAHVRIHTDELHVAHVFADSDAGVFRGLGFAQVRDFPVATLANLWSATGRFAEVAGAAVLERDERVRQWGIDRRAHAMATEKDELDAGVKGWLEAYVAGVNEGRHLWLDTPGLLDKLVGEERSLAFDPVPPWLSPLGPGKNGDPRARLARLFAEEVTLEHVLAFGIAVAAGPDFGGGGAAAKTNVWLMRGGEKDPHTRLLADVHQPLEEFGYRSYFVQLAGPEYDVVGLTSPGFPCVVLGASRTLAFASMTLPAWPRELANSEPDFRRIDRFPVVASAWSGELAADAPARLVRGEETLPLVERSATLRSFDVAKNALVDDPRGALALRWLRDEGLGLELPVVEPRPDQALEPGASVRFEARSFLGQRSVWEAWMKLGRPSDATGALRDLGRDGISVGRGQACLFGDVGGGRFTHVWSTRAARLTDEGRSSAGTAPLDGNDPKLRWLGFHDLRDAGSVIVVSPQPGQPVPSLGLVLCNSSFDFLVSKDGYPMLPPEPDIHDGLPWKTLRQDRARELFDRIDADGVHTTAELERMALDVQDQWSRVNWPWLRALADETEHPLSERARAFVDWIERFRFEGPDGKPGTEEFLAHPMSQVMPFMALVRDHSEDELVAKRARATALELAFDACFGPPPVAEFLEADRFAPNRLALRNALEWAAELREKTLANAPGGLVNTRYFTELGERWKKGGALFPAAFTPLLARTQASEWGTDAPPVALRWGEVNVYALTPHRPAADPRLDNARLVEGWLGAHFAPDTVEGNLPYFRAQTAVAFPIGGTHDTLFQTHHQSFSSYARSLVPRGEDRLELAPVDFGSQALLLVELREGARPFVRVLPALGATEITAAIPELSLGALEPYRVSERFARGEWSTLETDEARLKANPAVHTVVLGD